MGVRVTAGQTKPGTVRHLQRLRRLQSIFQLRSLSQDGSQHLVENSNLDGNRGSRSHPGVAPAGTQLSGTGPQQMTYKICPDHATRQTKRRSAVTGYLIKVRAIVLQQISHLNGNGCVQVNCCCEMMRRCVATFIQRLQEACANGTFFRPNLNGSKLSFER